jgi:hypothetical protein
MIAMPRFASVSLPAARDGTAMTDILMLSLMTTVLGTVTLALAVALAAALGWCWRRWR